MTEHIKFANDVGFSALKGYINGKHIYVPSIDAHEVPLDNTQRKDIHSEDISKYMSEYVNQHMHMKIQSPGITDDKLFIGDSANRATGAQGFTATDVQGHKYSAPLTRALTLGTIAGTVLQSYYEKHSCFPRKPLPVNVSMVAALPVSEATKPGCIYKYTSAYHNHGNSHVVTILNFEDNNTPRDIQINITFKHVIVGLEGQVADYGMKLLADSPLMMELKGQLEREYPSVYKWNTAHHMLTKSITNAQNILNMDIGEGTTDCVAIQNGSLDAHDSASFTVGCKDYLVLASRELQTKFGYSKASVENIREVLRKEPQSLQDQQTKDDYERAVNDNIKVISRKIASKFSLILNSQGTSFNMIYVFGGGSISMASHKYFRDTIKQAVSSLNGGHANIPVLFIPKRYAQGMNVYGLEYILKHSFK